jgi:AcrR family transcriptional regulator
MSSSPKNRKAIIPTDKPSQRTKVVEAAIESIFKEGIENLTFASVANVMGTRPSHIKYYYNDKKDLVLATFRYLLIKIQNYVVESIQDIKDPKQALEVYISSSTGVLEKNPRFWPLITLFLYYCSRNKEVRTLNEKFRETAVGRIGYFLSEMDSIPKKEIPALSNHIFMIVHIYAMEFIYDQSPEGLNRSKEIMLRKFRHLLKSYSEK